MPIQNIGTLLENIVVTEGALALLDVCGDPDAPLEFANGFAMPPRSPWVAHKKNAGFDDAVLDRVRDANDATLPDAVAYSKLLQANLLIDRAQGPNAAMLVLGAWRDRPSCRMWLNDVSDGHYGNAIPHLQRIHELAKSTSATIGTGMEHRVRHAWRSWCQHFTSLRNIGLKVYRNGKVAG